MSPHASKPKSHGLRQRLGDSVPSIPALVLGAVGWATAMGLTAQFALWLGIAAETFRYWQLTILFSAGGLMAWPVAIFLIRFCSLGRSVEVWIAASILFLSTSTIAITSSIFALIYRSYYVQWHDTVLTKLWLIQLVFTTASALYQFAVIGLRLYLPIGPLFLLAAALIITITGISEAKRRPFSTV